MMKMDLNKNAVIGLIVVFILGLIIGCSASRLHGHFDHNDYRSEKGSMMHSKKEMDEMMKKGDDAKMMDETMDEQMAHMTSQLEGKTGDELDKAFLQQMIVHHEGAVAMAQILVKGTKRPELQKMGKDIITVQTKEIEQMESWLTTWFSQN